VRDPGKVSRLFLSTSSCPFLYQSRALGIWARGLLPLPLPEPSIGDLGAGLRLRLNARGCEQEGVLRTTQRYGSPGVFSTFARDPGTLFLAVDLIHALIYSRRPPCPEDKSRS
jgi:hypothetical protein